MYQPSKTVSLSALTLSEWQYNFFVSKANDRKIILHVDFEAICSKYWSLAKSMDSGNRNVSTIDQKQYTEVSYKRLMTNFQSLWNACSKCCCLFTEKTRWRKKSLRNGLWTHVARKRWACCCFKRRSFVWHTAGLPTSTLKSTSSFLIRSTKE